MDLKKVYDNSPLLLQHLMLSIKGLQAENSRINKKETLEHLDFLLKSQYWSKDEIINYQNQQLQMIMKEAFDNVPYYIDLSKKTGLDYRDIKTQDDLKLLPVLKKENIRGNEKNFINKNAVNILNGSTSGSTGSPMKLFFTKESFSKRWAFELRLRQWAALKDAYEPRRVQFTGRDFIDKNNDKKVFWRYNYFLNTMHVSSFYINYDTAPALAAAIVKYKPEFIDGYPSSIAMLAKICLEKSIPLPGVKAVRVSAELLCDEDRRLIETAFSCKVFNQYGSAESSIFACDNEFGEMIISPEYGVTEILDANGNEVSAGEKGSVITTSFMNPNMPLIRYSLGDIVEKGSVISSKYGSNFERINYVDGRNDDVIFIKGKGYISRLGFLVKGMDSIYESQVVLEKGDLVNVRIVPTPKFNKDEENKLFKQLEKILGQEVAIKITVVKEIAKGPNGKFKYVINNTLS